MGNHRIACIARIVGLIHIYIATLKSVWLSMLHNRVSLLKWHLFIRSIPLLRVIGPCTFDGNIFNGTVLPIDITTTCYLWPSPGALNFFVGRDVRADRWNGRGHLYFGVDIILVNHHVKGLSKYTVSTYFPGGYTDPKYVFFSLDLFIMIYRGGDTSIVTPKLYTMCDRFRVSKT